MVRISVLYATAEGKRFGLVRTEVDKGMAGGAPGAPAPYVAIGHVYFNSLDGFPKGMGQHGKEIMGDVSRSARS